MDVVVVSGSAERHGSTVVRCYNDSGFVLTLRRHELHYTLLEPPITAVGAARFNR